MLPFCGLAALRTSPLRRLYKNHPAVLKLNLFIWGLVEHNREFWGDLPSFGRGQRKEGSKGYKQMEATIGCGGHGCCIMHGTDSVVGRARTRFRVITASLPGDETPPIRLISSINNALRYECALEVCRSVTTGMPNNSK